jgi:L-galactono-1,4-lactone dehydrogenase
VAQVNAAEAEFWRRAAGTRVGWSDELLGFDCGGEQWVHEVALPAGTAARPSGADLDYMESLLALVQRRGVPAPAPIEQRWSAGTASPMSPSHGAPGELFSWVGLIMYLPEDAAQRRQVTEAFGRYRRLVERELMGRYRAVEHWAKIEAPLEAAELAAARARLAARYPVGRFLEARRRLDPKNVLGNRLVDELLGSPAAGAVAAEGGKAAA